jgi:hypothetical protein
MDNLWMRQGNMDTKCTCGHWFSAHAMVDYGAEVVQPQNRAQRRAAQRAPSNKCSALGCDCRSFVYADQPSYGD